MTRAGRARSTPGMPLLRAPCLAVLLLAACTRSEPPKDYGPHEPAAASLRRLTQSQYRNAVHDLLGEDIVIAGALEPDSAYDELLAIGAAHTSVSPRGVDQYEALAYNIAEQVWKSDARRAARRWCAPRRWRAARRRRCRVRARRR